MKREGVLFQSHIHDKIVQLIAEYGYITVQEVSILTGDPYRAYQTLYYLQRKGVIHAFPTRLRPVYAYNLTPRYKVVLSSSGLVDYIRPFKPSLYKETQLYHSLGLIKLRLIFEQILGPRLKRYVSDNQLQRDKANKKICDAEITYTKDKTDKTIAVELELSAKRQPRIGKDARKLTEHAEGRYSAVLMIYSMPSVKETWQRVLKENNEAGVNYFFIHFSDFLKNKANCKAQDPNDKAIPLFKDTV